MTDPPRTCSCYPTERPLWCPRRQAHRDCHAAVHRELAELAGIGLLAAAVMFGLIAVLVWL
jgi:hypothetical protein